MSNRTDGKILETIDSPSDLKGLSIREKKLLAAEIRGELLDVVSKNGGHLAPNMGVVELTIALHSVFNAPEDKIVWDVGHQAYVHKLLTGRRKIFRTLRQKGGTPGFLSRNESEYDAFGAGHAGTAISAALGMAAARDRRKGREKVIALVGDGALTCGISLEGLNHIAEVTRDFILVINDNKMSISPNVGSVSKYLNRIISGRSYNRFKAAVRAGVRSIPGIGEDITRMVSKVEEAAKSMFVPGVIFEEIGMRYIGPVNGHDIEELERTLGRIKEFDQRPVVLHVITEKGRGYEPAEAAPEKFHGLSSFDPDTGDSDIQDGTPTFSRIFGESLCEIAAEDERVAAVTAAMTSGTGLADFAEKFSDRFYDVGIAEEHAIVFAAGLATGGMRPVVALYASFLQRALDCVFHDVCLQKLPVIICTDRSGVVDDGPTHHGIHDLAFLRNLPNLSILCPKDECELRNMLFAAFKHGEPVVIRYPRGKGAGVDIPEKPELPEWGKAEVVREGGDLAIWAAGREVYTALKTAEILSGKGVESTVVNTRFILPFDAGLLEKHAAKMPIATIEDCQVSGGLGASVDEALANSKHGKIIHFGWGREIVPHGPTDEIRKAAGMIPESIAEKLL